MRRRLKNETGVPAPGPKNRLRQRQSSGLLQSLGGSCQAVPRDVVALELAIQGRAADAEHLAGEGLVSFDLFKNALNGGAFDIFKVGGRDGTSEFRVGAG